MLIITKRYIHTAMIRTMPEGRPINSFHMVESQYIVHANYFSFSIRVAVVLMLGAASLIIVGLSKAVKLSLLGKYLFSVTENSHLFLIY